MVQQLGIEYIVRNNTIPVEQNEPVINEVSNSA
jgi:hypothetical protein